MGTYKYCTSLYCKIYLRDRERVGLHYSTYTYTAQYLKNCSPEYNIRILTFAGKCTANVQAYIAQNCGRKLCHMWKNEFFFDAVLG
jgi:hypothetical protein